MKKFKRSDVAQAFRDAKLGTGVQVVFLDDEYKAVDEETLLTNVRATHTDALKYETNYADCDKHSRLLWALLPFKYGLNSVGLVLDWSARHSYNVAFTDSLKLVWLEPQTDEEVAIHSQPMYALDQGMIIV